MEGGGGAAAEIAGACVAVRLRTLHRVVNGIYDDALRPHGVGVGQLNLLVAIARLAPARPADVCRFLRMDKSTLSRDAKVLVRRGWLAVEADDAGRARGLQLSPAGAALLEAVLPAWREAQAKAAELLGVQGTKALGRAAAALAAG